MQVLEVVVGQAATAEADLNINIDFATNVEANVEPEFLGPGGHC